MSGQNIFTTLGRDRVAEIFKEHVTKFRLGEGGYQMSSLVTEVIDAGATGFQKVYSYIVTGGDFDIINVNTGTKTFTIDGDHVALFEVDAVVRVMDSTANDGKYTVASCSLVAGDTEIVVNETIPSATIDGVIYVDKLPICKGPTTGLLHHSLAVVEYSGATMIQKIEDVAGIGALEQTIGGVTGSGILNYKNGHLDVEFANYVGAGNQVKVEFKYANKAKTPTAGQIKLDSQLDTEGPGGTSSLFTFERTFVDAELVLRGVGYATLRCIMELVEPEGIDDGWSYGGTPYYFEGGIFDDDDVMLCYFTFDKERKSGSTTMRHTVDIVV
jgi:hypothetical protein